MTSINLIFFNNLVTLNILKALKALIELKFFLLLLDRVSSHKDTIAIVKSMTFILSLINPFNPNPIIFNMDSLI